MKHFDEIPLDDKLLKKIYAYYQTIWRDKWKERIDVEWLSNFNDPDEETFARERSNMIYLLSKFMYFGNEQLRQLLIALYRDLVVYPITEKIRRNNNNTLDEALIDEMFKAELNQTKFLGVGNPSESGVHMLYYFRQENKLRKSQFINSSEIFSTNQIKDIQEDGSVKSRLLSKIADNSIKRYVFIDDFCGSGTQATQYLKIVVENMKFEDPTIEVNYLMVFGSEKGVATVKSLNLFNSVNAVFTIDDSFKAFSAESRYYKIVPHDSIDKDFACQTAQKYGSALFNPPLGFDDSQLLLGLYHNTPDNSLPIFWGETAKWKPIFKRYHKMY